MTAAAPSHLDPDYRRGLAACAVLNAVMLVVEGGVGLVIGSAALIADAVDFLEDAGIYALAVAAVGWSARSRARAGLAMGCASWAWGSPHSGRSPSASSPAAPPRRCRWR